MNEQIALLIKEYYLIQRHRIILSNQIFAYKKDKKPVDLLEYFYEKFASLETEIEKSVAKSIKTHPMFKWLKAVKGIGPLLAASLLTGIDINKTQHASSVWKYCGMAVDEEGHADRMIAGKKLNFNPYMKQVCWKIGESFVKVKGHYRSIYDSSKEFYQRKFPEEVKIGKKTNYTKLHIHNMAKRRAVKVFLCDMWMEWRAMEGLPVSEPYMHRGLPKKEVKIKKSKSSKKEK